MSNKSEKWKPPTSGVVELDFVDLDDSICEEPISNADFLKLQRAMQNNISDVSRQALLRTACSAYYFDSVQALSLVLMFGFDRHRENAAIVLWSRIVDKHNFPGCVLSALSDACVHSVADRLGPARVFMPHDPAGRYRLDMCKNGDREVFQTLVGLTHTNEGDHFAHCALDGSVTAYESVIDFTKPGESTSDSVEIPSEGFIEFTYVSAKGRRTHSLFGALKQGIKLEIKSQKLEAQKEAAAAKSPATSEVTEVSAGSIPRTARTGASTPRTERRWLGPGPTSARSARTPKGYPGSESQLSRRDSTVAGQMVSMSAARWDEWLMYTCRWMRHRVVYRQELPKVRVVSFCMEHAVKPPNRPAEKKRLQQKHHAGITKN